MYANFCVYAIRHSDALAKAYAAGGTGTFAENAKWVTARKLLDKAHLDQETLLVVFAASDIATGLLYHATLKDIEIDETGTAVTSTYRFAGLTRIDPSRPISTLIRKNGNQPLSENYIRSYVICHTPEFLLASTADDGASRDAGLAQAEGQRV